MLPLQYIAGGWPRIFGVIGVGFLALEMIAHYSNSIFAWLWSPTQVLSDDLNLGNAVIATFIAFIVGECCFAAGRFAFDSGLINMAGSVSFDEIVVYSDDKVVGNDTRTVIRQALNIIELFSALFFCSLLWTLAALLDLIQGGAISTIGFAALACVVSFLFARINQARAYRILLISDGREKGIFNITNTRADQTTPDEDA